MTRKNKIGEFFPFYPQAWIMSTDLQRCSLGARGLLAELMARTWLKGRRGEIKTSIDDLAFDTHTSYEEVARLLDELSQRGRISTVEGDRYILITIPTLSDVQAEQEALLKAKSKAGTKSGESRTKKKKDEEAFELFWEVYPKKRDKQRCQRFWATHNLTAKVEEIVAGIEMYKIHWANTGTEEQFIPYPSTWLNGGRWEDELEIKGLKPKMTEEEKDAAREDFLRRAK